MQVLSRQRGVSLIEVLMAVLIFSVGLIGLAGRMVMAARSNHAAYQRTQMTFLANNMADRMRANPLGIWSGSYDSAAFPITGKTDCETTACTPADVAKRDQQTWSGLLTTLLPKATASIKCASNSYFRTRKTKAHASGFLFSISSSRPAALLRTRRVRRR